MRVHEIVFSEPDPSRRGLFRRLYARIETSFNGTYWMWRQVDENGYYLSEAEKAFGSEDEALNDAVFRFNGIAVAI
jgi:hypothetical protein